MTFLNATLAIGAAACAIPVLIHLLNRRRHRVIRWAAMHLLAPIARTNRRRIRLEQLILLLVRMAILALLALCMAGPVLTRWRALAGDAKTSLAVIFDNSYSMEAGTVGASGLERARRQTAELIEAQPRGSDVSLSLLAGGRVFSSTAASTNLARVAESLRELPSGFGAADLDAGFENATRALAAMQNSKRDLLIVSDFQSNDWAQAEGASLERARELIAAIPIRPTVTLMQIGNPITENVSIESIEISPDIIAVGQTATIRVNLTNHGDVPFPGVAVELQIDRQSKQTASIDLAADETGQLLFEQVFDDAGHHSIEVRADADTLHIDNRFRQVVEVFDRMPVLLVDGDRRATSLASETGFLQLALSPFATAEALRPVAEATAVMPVDAIASDVVSDSEFDPDDLEGAKVVVLANVARLGDDQLRAVRDYVASGGSLLVFAGEKIDVEWYRAKMCAAAGLMPMTFESIQPGESLRPVPLDRQDATGDAGDAGGVGGRGEAGETEVSDSIAGRHTTISDEPLDHPALSFFNESRHGVLSEATIRKWYRLSRPGFAFGQQLRLSEQTLADDDAAEGKLVGVIARLAGDDPFLVESSLGRGRVIACATSCDEDWSNLPSRPLFLPLMQRLIVYLATVAQPQRNLSTGQTISARLDEGRDRATITRPDGETVEIVAGGLNGLLEYAETDQEGWYTLQASSLPPMPFAVTAPRSESELERLDDAAMDELAESFAASRVTSAEEFLQQDSVRRYGRAIWKELYAAVAVLVLLEILLQQWFSGLFSRSSAAGS